MKREFNPPPGWPTPPADWLPANGWKPDSGWPPAPPGWQFWVEEATPKDVARRVAILVVLAAFTYAFPLYGLPVSLCLPVLTFNFRQHLWRGVTRRFSLFCAMLAWVGLWWPAAVGLLTGWSPGASEPVSTAWLLMPLCGPDWEGVIALPALVALPALAATVVCTLGLVSSVAARQPWFWVAAAWAAPWAHHLVLTAFPHRYVC